MKISIKQSWQEGGTREKLAIISDAASIAGVSLIAILSPLVTSSTPQSAIAYISLAGVIALFALFLVVLVTVGFGALLLIDHVAKEAPSPIPFLLKVVVVLMCIVVGSQIVGIGIHVISQEIT